VSRCRACGGQVRDDLTPPRDIACSDKA